MVKVIAERELLSMKSFCRKWNIGCGLGLGLFVLETLSLGGCTRGRTNGVLLSDHLPGAYAVDASRNGATVAALGDAGEIEFFDLDLGLKVTTHRLGTREFGLSPMGNEAACVVGRNRIVFVDSKTGLPHRTVDLPVTDLGYPRYSPDGRVVAVASGAVGTLAKYGSEILILDTRTLKVIRRMRSFNVSLSRCALSFSPDGGLLAAGGWDHAALLDVRTGRVLKDLRKQFTDGYLGGWVEYVCFSSDGKAILLGNLSLLRRYEMSDLRQGERIAVPEGIRAIGALGPHDFWIASSNGETSRLNGKANVFLGWLRKREGCGDVAKSVDGSTLVSSWEGGDITVVTVASR